VRVTEDSVVRTHSHIVGLIEEARLPDRTRRRSLAAFAALARAEAALHRRPTSQVHFHEVGGLDAIVDLVGTNAALEVLDVDLVTASPVATGTGVVRTAHGILPNPAPAVVELLRGVPTQGRDINVELTTPSGAAILVATATEYGPLPSMMITATGFGAGQRDLDQLPNCTQVVLGTPLETSSRVSGQPVTLLEVNVDDTTGERLAHAVAELMAAGAHDAWITPVIMKKGRPGHTVSVLADPAVASSLSEVLRVETGSLGVRGQVLERWPASREQQEVDIEGVPVRVKVSPGRVKVEHDDAVRAARRSGLPLAEVLWRAETAWRRHTNNDDDSPSAS
jgi:uncharacterized protein (TIGR00299 family) protein